MRRYLTWNWLLVGAVPLSLLLALATGYWMLGAFGAAGALCGLAIRNPHWTPRLWRHKAEELNVPNRTEDWSPPPPPRPPTARRVAADNSLVEQMISQGREALLLRPQIAASLSDAELAAAQVALDESMAIVPQGGVLMRARCYEDLEEPDALRGERLVQVEGFFLDRYPVTNGQYLLFIEGGGYEQMSLWDESIWPAVLGFTDETGMPGPRYWENGRYPAGKEDHPVVGVSWFEAAAFARWAGKRLPTDPEWVKSGSWPVSTDGGRPQQRKFPWGEAMDRRYVNLWGSGINDTVTVTASPDSASIGGVQQLIGNVWEWTSSNFGHWEPAGRKVETPIPHRSIRGGAFDTYFDNQAHCQFQSGESPLARKHNIGFRCALGFCDVVIMPSDSPELETAPACEEVQG